ncbi:Sec-independent protein translocase TatB [Acetobacter pomorum DSM 11825]|nr:Sec-independent protein translocase TatB [Acetobacter pomorum DSM 11825]
MRAATELFMFDFAWSEIALIGAVALVVIGPKDLPVAIRGLAGALKKARKLAGEFQSHVDEMVREADLTEVRDQVRDLKNLNVRNRIMKAIDSDGTLSSSFAPPPQIAEQHIPAGPRALDMPASSTQSTTSIPPYVPSTYEPVVTDDDIASAPPELPPNIVRRILKEQERLHPPAFLPPVRVMHAGRSVAPGERLGRVSAGPNRPAWHQDADIQLDQPKGAEPEQQILDHQP